MGPQLSQKMKGLVEACDVVGQSEAGMSPI